MVSPATINKSNSPAPWMGTTTPREEDVSEEKSQQPTGLFPLITGASVITATVPTNLTISSQVITISPEDASRLGSLRDITTGNISQTTSTLSLNDNRLISFGVLLATGLAKTLNQIRALNEQAIYPIMSILEPFIEVPEALNLDMPPKSSLRVVAKVIDKGKAEPEFYYE